MNNKIQIIPFEPKHLDQIELKENFIESECPRTVMTSAFTLIRGNTVMAIIGAFPFVPGVFHFWAFISKHVRECPLDFQRNCLKIIAWYEKTQKPRRIQFEVDVTYDMGCRWAESLGMRSEGVMQAWGPSGQDCVLYARINKEVA